jgi:hypothetical protein
MYVISRGQRHGSPADRGKVIVFGPYSDAAAGIRDAQARGASSTFVISADDLASVVAQGLGLIREMVPA